MMETSLETKPGPGRPRVQDVDRQVGARMRDRRVLLGLTQPKAAELIGVSYQQWHKYEKGINRVAAGRLSMIAQALGVEVGHFFSALDEGPVSVPGPPQRLFLELVRLFVGLSRQHQEALCSLAGALASPELTTAAGSTELQDEASAA